MSKVSTGATMSLDGYIAGPEDSGFDLLFRWYGNGDVVVETNNPELSFSTTAEDAEALRDMTAATGCLVVGRHLYDLTNAWGGRHPMDVPTVVLTHNPPADRPVEDENFVFVTEGIEAAVAKAKEIAGENDVTLASPDVIRQALDLGLVDEICVALVPVLFGEGISYFGKLDRGHLMLEDPIVVQGHRALHLRYPVRR